jgi:hypothetical protein
MLPVKAWIYGKLIADPTLLGLLGSVNNILDYDPQQKSFFPIVIFLKANESDTLWNDDMPLASDVTFHVEVYTQADSSMPTTAQIGTAVVNVLQPLLFSCKSRDLPDPSSLLRHLHMEFRRAVVAGDLA